MGDQQISPLSSQSKSEFLRHLLDDIQSLQQMIADGFIEKGVTRIGAEQELCLVNQNLRPAMTGPAILATNDEPSFTPELAQWNLEINLDPADAEAGCLVSMHTQLNRLLHHANDLAKTFDSSVVLTGILPTIRKSELDFKYMTPNPRYRVLDQILKNLRGEDFTLYVEGVDEINLKHDSILFEACNTSFQVHLQIDPDEFVDKYNWAQVLAGPVLAAAVNSPLLLGKELWSETRIALFRQSIEIRNSGKDVRDKQPRVAFGGDWLRNSAVEIFKDDIAFYKLIVASKLDSPGSAELLSQGLIPELRAMNLHNGTVYKWNRACYGVGNGKPHLRIENRYIPSGPTSIDEMANATFWIGLMQSVPEQCCGAWDQHFYFQEVRSNFLKAAQHGLSNQLRWFGQSIDADRLILDTLLPMAESGLQKLGIPSSEFDPYLRVIQQRVEKRQTGTSWMIDSLRSLRSRNTVDESILMITRHLQENCLGDVPVHQWKLPHRSTLTSIPNRYERVDCIMTTNVVTVHEDDLIELAQTLMTWKQIHHLPVENDAGEISGILSSSDIDRYLTTHPKGSHDLVASCMTSDFVFVSPETLLEEVEKTMADNAIGSLPVVRDQRVIGIITERDVRMLRKKIDTE